MNVALITTNPHARYRPKADTRWERALLLICNFRKWRERYICPPMDRTVARLNIEHYHKLLATETDETRRQMLSRLLAEEEAKLAAFEDPTKRKTDR